MLYITIASTSPMAPLIWLGIVVGVLGAAVWQDASETDRPFDPDDDS